MLSTGPAVTVTSTVPIEVRGTLFQGLRLFVLQRVPQRSRYIAQIRNNGGEVVIQDSQADVCVADHLRKDSPPGSISYTWIEKSIAAGERLSWDEHRAGPPVGLPRPIGSALPRKQTRFPYTHEDDRVLYHWVQEYRDKGGADWKGNELYKQLEQINTRHPWQSWRDRYIKYVQHQPPPAAPNPPPQKASQPPTQATGTISNSTSKESVAAVQSDPSSPDTQSSGEVKEAAAALLSTFGGSNGTHAQLDKFISKEQIPNSSQAEPARPDVADSFSKTSAADASSHVQFSIHASDEASSPLPTQGQPVMPKKPSGYIRASQATFQLPGASDDDGLFHGDDDRDMLIPSSAPALGQHRTFPGDGNDGEYVSTKRRRIDRSESPVIVSHRRIDPTWRPQSLFQRNSGGRKKQYRNDDQTLMKEEPRSPSFEPRSPILDSNKDGSSESASFLPVGGNGPIQSSIELNTMQHNTPLDKIHDVEEVGSVPSVAASEDAPSDPNLEINGEVPLQLDQAADGEKELAHATASQQTPPTYNGTVGDDEEGMYVDNAQSPPHQPLHDNSNETHVNESDQHSLRDDVAELQYVTLASGDHDDDERKRTQHHSDTDIGVSVVSSTLLPLVEEENTQENHNSITASKPAGTSEIHVDSEKHVSTPEPSHEHNLGTLSLRSEPDIFKMPQIHSLQPDPGGQSPRRRALKAAHRLSMESSKLIVDDKLDLSTFH